MLFGAGPPTAGTEYDGCLFEKNGRQYRILPLQAGKVLDIIEQGMEYARQNMGMPLLTTWLGAGIGSAFEE